jgi:hypothetical protein
MIGKKSESAGVLVDIPMNLFYSKPNGTHRIKKPKYLLQMYDALYSYVC